MQAPPERLGSFYLGAQYDLKAGKRSETPVNYDARDLTTHSVCVGMTGDSPISGEGKTVGVGGRIASATNPKQ